MTSKTALGLGAAIVVLVSLVYLFFPSGRYGTLSREGYQYAQALYTCCNQRDERKLEQLSEMIASAQSEDALSEEEASWLGAIVSQGRAGDWESAASEVRKLLEDQIQATS